MGYARFRVTDQLFLRALGLPLDTEFINAKIARDDIGVLEFIVSHPDLKGTLNDEGNMPPLVCPTIRRNQPLECEWVTK